MCLKNNNRRGELIGYFAFMLNNGYHFQNNIAIKEAKYQINMGDK